jgi:PPM family protein phosphatase
MNDFALNIAAITQVGLVRKANEDSIVVGSWIAQAALEAPEICQYRLDKPIVLAVCDGMGGQAAGDVASLLAASAISDGMQGEPTEDKASSALYAINDNIYAAAACEPRLAGMGTTIAGVWIGQDKLVWFNAGDSSVFRFANGFLMKLSLDDRLDGSRSNVLTKSLGGGNPYVALAPHTGTEALRSGASYLVCSDGLTDMLSLSLIETEMRKSPQEASAALCAMACAAGGHDNVSIIVVAIDGQGEEQDMGGLL